ncbi:flagellar biosynthesis protein FlhB [Orrella sp. JC864]|uniref:flagellar biosynthesis protein FlhB n=1 Tax=Orrella sp. JC864 TaxID=3120298 RepID=UPI0012BCAA12
MAEDSDLEKTEPASPRRLEKAREEGQVARSRELVTFALLTMGAAGLWIGGGALYERLRGVVRNGMTFDAALVRDPGATLAVTVNGAMHALLAILPLFGLLAVTAVLATAMLGGFLLSNKALQPQFGRLNPIKGFARLFSAQTLVELFKTIAKALLVGGVAVWVLWSHRDEMLSLMHAAPIEGLARSMQLVALCAALIIASLILVVAIDAPWQIFSHLKKLRMSKEDLRQEHKESEGDPHVKARIRQQQRAMARRRMMSQVPGADVVVTNPTHYAVALKYQDGTHAAPVVVAKGTNLIAARIRELAEQHRVPLLEAPALARALHHHVELDREIPAALYSAVAEVLAWVFQLRAWRAGQAAAPSRPAGLPVPRELDPLAARASQGA